MSLRSRASRRAVGARRLLGGRARDPSARAARIEKAASSRRQISRGRGGDPPVDIIDMRLRDAVSLIRGKKARASSSRCARGRDLRALPLVIERDTIVSPNRRPRCASRSASARASPTSCGDRADVLHGDSIHKRQAPTTGEAARAGEGGEGRRPAARPVANGGGLLEPAVRSPLLPAQGRGGRRAELAPQLQVLAIRTTASLHARW